jgi:hypothetical protein
VIDTTDINIQTADVLDLIILRSRWVLTFFTWVVVNVSLRVDGMAKASADQPCSL